MSENVNRILKGNNGYVWINGLLVGYLKSIEAKLTGNFEDIVMAGDNATHSTYNGYTGDGTLTIYKTNSRNMSAIAESFKTGVMPEIKIITKLTDTVTGQSERVAITEVVFTETMLANIAERSNIEEAIPFKFADYLILERIA
ncbi:MAG: phage tail tube protein [Oscillospiraceae bacterium]